MLTPLLLGTLTIFINMVVQILATVVLLHIFLSKRGRIVKKASVLDDIWILVFTLSVLFAGNIVQFTIWASLFMYLGEFNEFATAFYHSTVNFTSLGYGDIVMSEQWRLLGALEAANGVLMFGLTAGTMFSFMQHIVRQHQPAKNSN
ncbi:MAG: transporter [Porticoccaceae bacterium]|nr:MAG: transporter [Porticoccaceae bacterium]